MISYRIAAAPIGVRAAAILRNPSLCSWSPSAVFAALCAFGALGCEAARPEAAEQTPPTPAPSSVEPAPPGTASANRTNSADPITVVLGGDVSFGRSVGQRVLSDSNFAPFAGLAPYFAGSDLGIVNLESILSDQGGLTEHPLNPLVFSGPVRAADTLKRAGIHAVSVANNHAWDYAKPGLSESLAALKAAGIVSAGASAEWGKQYTPAFIEVRGVRFALLAFTQVWNDGKLDEHVAKDFVAGSDYEAMKLALRRARKRASFVIASLHASNEYVSLPRERARRFARALVVSGADLVFGHHPHVVQGVEWVHDTPILYSLGNLVFDSRQDRPESKRGALARVELRRSDDAWHVARIELCPVRLETGIPEPSDEVATFAREVEQLSKTLGGVEARAVVDNGGSAAGGVAAAVRGCVRVEESSHPLPYERRRGFNPDPENPNDEVQ